MQSKEMDDYDKSPILEVLEHILAMKKKIKVVSDMAFEAVDDNDSGQLDKDELGITLKSVAKQMGINAPSENDIMAVLGELDQDDDAEVSKEEFEYLIVKVLEKMAESEVELQNTIAEKRKAAQK